MNKFLFYLSARMFGEACLELYICRLTPEGKQQVYLIPRPANDPFYPSMLHMPGARKIPTEMDGDHLRRAIKETPFNLTNGCVEYIMSTTLKAKRGVEYADIRRIVVPYNSEHRNFYDVNSLPGDIISHHVLIINIVKGLDCQ